MNEMVNIGASVEAIEAARDMIIDIMTANAADAVKVEALKTAATICEVKNATVTNCTFTSASAPHTAPR